ncbi:MAG: hypothetical protein II395_04540 [Ruminococcus sp.]|nr:hypothetical protein [Ruminococcus sp.]
MYSGGKRDASSGNTYPLLSEAIKSGLFHPNCKDSTSTYYEGITTLQPVTEEEQAEMERREQLEQQQSYYENQAKKNRRIAEYSLDADNKRTCSHRAEVFEQKAQNAEKVLANSGESGIIKVRGEGMYRKSKQGKIEPMPKKQFHRLEKSFRRRGGIIQHNPATDDYLSTKHAEGITYDSKTILLKQNPGRASVFEELIHAHQYRTGKNDGSYLSRLNSEIDAQRKLLRHSTLFQLTQQEIEQTKSALKSYKNELEEYYKKGGK